MFRILFLLRRLLFFRGVVKQFFSWLIMDKPRDITADLDMKAINAQPDIPLESEEKKPDEITK